MHAYLKAWLLFFCAACLSLSHSGCQSSGDMRMLEAHWITHPALVDSASANQWIAFSKSFDSRSYKEASIKIAADTKYWLWLNDSLIMREGGLKWGPRPNGYYVDSFDISEHLVNGQNTLDVLCWYFGKDGFSHKNSGRPGIHIMAPKLGLKSDSTWKVGLHMAFRDSTGEPRPNYRLPESNIHFDARNTGALKDANTTLLGFDRKAMTNAKQFDRPGYPIAEIRPIPFWKDYGLRKYADAPPFPLKSDGAPVVVTLPYNAQVTPYFEIEALAGNLVDIRTDNYRGGSAYNVRTEYVTSNGRQVFETPGWMNGHKVEYRFPKDVTIYDLKYRESGYQTTFAGDFTCNDSFYNALWKKAQRTLYVTMRDNYMDCPDRERAQWWGDVVLELGETFYALDRSSDLLTRKAILELMHWQRSDSTIYAPVPSGNWAQELPTQMLASVGYYGIWTYFWHTGDTATLQRIYPSVRKYLGVWKQDSSGLVIPRKGGWTWGDWGPNKDMSIIFNGWYYLALKGLMHMALTLGDEQTAVSTSNRMERLKNAFNENFWTGTGYRSPGHQGDYDDRAQALAVVTGIALPEYHGRIRIILLDHMYCSPYFEKYVLEALFLMGYPRAALERMRTRFGDMVKSELTTLWEGWDLNSSTWGGGTYNHAWSGGGLTLLSQFVAGIKPTAAGYHTVLIRPQMGSLSNVRTRMETPLGILEVTIEKKGESTHVHYTAPPNMEVVVSTDN